MSRTAKALLQAAVISTVMVAGCLVIFTDIEEPGSSPAHANDVRDAKDDLAPAERAGTLYRYDCAERTAYVDYFKWSNLNIDEKAALARRLVVACGQTISTGTITIRDDKGNRPLGAWNNAKLVLP